MTGVEPPHPKFRGGCDPPNPPPLFGAPALLDSNHETLPSKNDNGCRDFIVPGYNDYAKELHCEARIAYITWKRAGRPRTGVFCSDMRTSRLRFKYALRLCKRNELSSRANAHAKSLLDKYMVSFWKGIRKETTPVFL